MSTAVGVLQPTAVAARPAARLALRVAIAATLVWACLGSPGQAVLRASVPLQRATFAMLMPDFDVHSFALAQRGAQFKLAATTVNRRYLLLRGRAFPPGIGFDVETPARAPLLYCALLLGGAALLTPAKRRSLWRAALIILLAAAVALLLTAPMILAGQQWALGLGAMEELSLAAVWVTASEFLLHGGGLALCAALVWIGAAAGRTGSA